MQHWNCKLTVCVALCLFLAWAHAEGNTTIWNDLTSQQQTDLVNLALKGRYMEEQFEGAVTMDRWDGFPLKRYSYSSSRWGRLQVILLDPTGEQAARWVVNAVVQVRGKYDHGLALALMRHIHGE
jgi:hypothetical protein